MGILSVTRARTRQVVIMRSFSALFSVFASIIAQDVPNMRHVHPSLVTSCVTEQLRSGLGNVKIVSSVLKLLVIHYHRKDLIKQRSAQTGGFHVPRWSVRRNWMPCLLEILKAVRLCLHASQMSDF